MSQPPITKKLFSGWFVVFTIGMVLWAYPGDLLWVLAIGIVTISNLLLMPRQELSRPLTTRDVMWSLGALFAFAVLIFALARWMPEGSGEFAEKIIRYPGFVVILWALSVFHTFRRYKISNQP